MKNNIAAAIGAAVGAVAGGISGWLMCKKYYEKLAQDEIDSVKERFTVPRTKMVEPIPEQVPENPVKHQEKPEAPASDREIYNSRPAQNRTDYTKCSAPDTNPEGEFVARPGEHAKENSDIHIEYIAPEQVGNDFNYETINLTYYSDGTLADDEDEVISAEDIDLMVGEFFWKHFDEYEEDMCFVRNTVLKRDYEIEREARTYDAAMSDIHRWHN